MFDISLRVESIRDVCQKKTRENVGILKKKTGGEGMRFKISLFKISCSKFLFLFEWVHWSVRVV